MAYDFGINFRASSGYVTNGANETYVLSELYPVTRGGLTFGWSSTGSLQVRDRNASYDRRIAGTHFPQAGYTFRIDLPATGLWQIHLALGDLGGAWVANWLLKDNGVSFATMAESGSSGTYDDATGTNYSAANWPNSEVAISHTFTSTLFQISRNAVGDQRINHVRLVQADAPSGNPHAIYSQQQ